MYWEDVYEMFEHASNLNILEKNDEMRFQFALHAASKNNRWKNLEIPYPDKNYIKQLKEEVPKRKFSNIDQKVAHVLKRDKASPERIALRDTIRDRIIKNQEKAADILSRYRNG